MATATFKFVPNNKLAGFGDAGERTITYYGSIVFSAATDTYATGGLLPLAGFTPINLGPYADRTPLFTYISSTAGQAWSYLWNPGTGKLQIFGGGGSATNALQEVTNGTALNATTPTISTDVVLFNMTLPRL